MGNLLIGLGKVIDIALTLYMIIVVASAVISWVGPDPYNPIVRFLRQATDPVYRYIRRYLPWLQAGGLDLTPLIVILAIVFLQYAVAQNLILWGVKLRGGF